MMVMESFSTQPLASVIQSYLYQEYAQDDDLQAFVDAYNGITQGYQNWFLANPLGLYTAPGISGQLLDWIAQGVYGIQRPTLASQTTIITAGYDSTAYDTVPYNYLSYSSAGTAQQTTDDIFKRILTWNLYRGDGQIFTLQWLKNRIARFLHGPNGADAAVLNYQPSIAVAGTTFTVSDFATADFTTLQLCMAAYSLAFPFQYQLAFNAVAFTNASGVLHLANALYYPTSAAGLAPGAVWYNAGSINVVPGVTPDPNAPAVYFGQIDPVQLLTIGGGNLPISNQYSVTNQPFGTGDGSTTAFQLKINGYPISSYTGTPKIYRADWQGNILLSTVARTNLALNSSSPSSWTLSSVTAGAAIAAPDGTAGAFLYAVPSTSSVSHYVRTPAAVPASTQVTISFFAKAGGYTKVIPETTALGMTGGNRTFDLSAGTVSTGGGSAAIAPVPGQPGVYRCAVTFTTGAGPYTNGPALFIQNYGAFAGDGTSGAYVWGMQVEVGGAATPYIATGSSAATVTDYTLSTSGGVTMGVAPVLNASLTWTGTGVPSGSKQLWNNAGVVSIL